MSEDSSQTVRILVVDDDPAMQQMVVNYLEEHNMRAVTATGRQDMSSQFAATEPNLVILDLRLGEEDGLDLLREIRSRSDVPVIITTGHRRDEIDRVVGLELGADDYLAKPCELRELLARIRVVLRRGTAPAAAAPAAATRPPIRFGTKWLDVDARVLRDDGGNEHPLASSEFALLKAFAENPKRVLTRERLLDLAEARDREAFDRAIDVRITRIRKKIEPDPTRPSVIRTVRGAGYLFSPDGAEPG
jgi:two-component system, OmpR family, response regulator